MIGDEFKTARLHLLKNLEGNIAWKDPAQAEEQKKRLAALHDAHGVSPEAPTDLENQSGNESEDDGETESGFAISM